MGIEVRKYKKFIVSNSEEWVKEWIRRAAIIKTANTQLIQKIHRLYGQMGPKLGIVLKEACTLEQFAEIFKTISREIGMNPENINISVYGFG